MAGHSGKTASGQQAEPVVEFRGNILAPSAFTRAAASSKASGIPSNRWQICTTALAFWSLTEKVGTMATARSMKSWTAS
jgi:hypothetical protein